MNTPVETVLSELNLTSKLLALPNEKKQEYLYFYEKLFLAYKKRKDKNSLEYMDVNNNRFTYDVLMNKLVFMTLLKGTPGTSIINMNNIKELPRAIDALKSVTGSSSEAYNQLYKQLKDGLELEPKDNITNEEFKLAIESYGVQQADSDDLPEDLEYASEDEENAIFNDDEEDEAPQKDKESAIKEILNTIKTGIKAAEENKVDINDINIYNNWGLDISEITTITDNGDSVQGFKIKVTVEAEASALSDEDLDITIIATSSDDELDIFDDNPDTIIDGIINYIESKMSSVDVKETTDDFDSTTEDNEPIPADDVDDIYDNDFEYIKVRVEKAVGLDDTFIDLKDTYLMISSTKDKLEYCISTYLNNNNNIQNLIKV